MNEKNQQSNSGFRRGQALAAPFFTVLFCLTLLAFLIPLRPTRSETEKRNLAQFPPFSLESLWSGDWFDGISLWFSDTFPGREDFIRVNETMEHLHGLQRSVVSTESVSDRNDNDALDALLEQAEKPAAAPVVPTTEPLPSPEPTVDPNAEIEEWEGLDAEDEMKMYSSLVMIGGRIFGRTGFSQFNSDRHAQMANRAGDIYAEHGWRFFNLPVPTSVGVLVASDMLEELQCADQGKMLRYMFAQENDNVYKVNCFNELLAHNTEQIYYNTDHHWSALGAYYAYTCFCREAGFEPVPLSEYEAVNMGEFRGTYYAQLGAVPNVIVDEMIAYVPPGNVRMEIPEYPMFTTPVVDHTEHSVNSKYNAFIAGDNPLTILTNDDLPDAPDCIVLKDSFGNPFSIFLTQHYHHVYVLDYRKNSRPLSSFAEEYGVQDILLVQSISVSQTESALNLLDGLLK